ncbi:MAG TPA: SDR family NAD(P)-dependent oxidoreductase [Bacteroidales bacterium]|nr:SDR family NAD(P)-dependent oxidoreductase [Bacteroidales bacterium]HRZ50298.1 SDR family NAD(P)-dependent oxidoreductase [Bacteroidales bacterium]
MKTQDKKNILVTGADGFIGSHLTELLLQEGYRVRALSLYNSFNFHGWLEGISHPDLEVVTGDIRDPYLCRKLTEDADLVFNLAALIAIPFSYVAPDLYVETNVKGTLNLCQAALDNKVQRFVQVSTSEVYGTARYVPIDEKHPKQPQSPYSATKIGADAMALSYCHAYGLPVTVARPFNTYGPRQSARAVIPTIISQLLAGAVEIHLGDTTPTRDFCFVTDTCRALLALANAPAEGIEVNIATGSEISIGDLFMLIRDLTGKEAVIVADNERFRPKNSEVFRLCGDTTLLQQLTGFKPATPLREGLRATISWFSHSENLKQYKTGIYNI